MPTIIPIFFLFFSSSVKSLIFPSFLYLASIDEPSANPKATPIAGPIPINPMFPVQLKEEFLILKI